MMFILLATLGWVVCGAFGYASQFAYFQRKYSTLAIRDYKRDRKVAMFGGLMGPFSLLLEFIRYVFVGHTWYGFKWR